MKMQDSRDKKEKEAKATGYGYVYLPIYSCFQTLKLEEKPNTRRQVRTLSGKDYLRMKEANTFLTPYWIRRRLYESFFIMLDCKSSRTLFELIINTTILNKRI